MTQTDVRLAGVLPLVLSRTHVSSYRVGRWFGPSWASTLDQRLEVDGEGAWFASADGMLLRFPVPPAGGEPVWPVVGPRLSLVATMHGYEVSDAARGYTWRFVRPGGETAAGVRSWPLTSLVDRNGNRIDLEYDETETLTGVRHSGGYHIRVDTAGGRITGLSLGEQELVRFGYDDSRQLTHVYNSSGLPLVFDYDADGRMISWTDRIGGWYRYDYDGAGRCVRTTGADGVLECRIVYDEASRTTSVTDSLGHIRRYVFNQARQIVREIDPLGRETARQWDQHRRLLSRTDPLGRTYRYTYDEPGSLTSIVRPDESRVLISGRAFLPDSITDSDGTTWQYEYDRWGNLIASTDPLGGVSRFHHDHRGHLTAITDATGLTTRIETDQAGLPVTVTDPGGGVTRYRRDRLGRIVEVVDPLGSSTSFAWTVEGRLAIRTLPDGTSEHWRYDAEGNLVEHTDSGGGAWRIDISKFDVPSARTGPDGARVEFRYDSELRLTAAINPQGLAWRYEYDAAGELVAETDFNGRTVRYGYDAAGQLTSRSDDAGRVTTFVRDWRGSVVERRTGDSVASFVYDAAGRLVRATTADSELTYERDAVGRVLAETCNDSTVHSRYDAAGRRTWRRTPSGVESTWSFDANGLPVELRIAGRRMRFDRDLAGREVTRWIGPTLSLVQDWDPSHRLLEQTLAASGKESTGFSPDGEGGVQLLQRRAYRYRSDGALTEVDDLRAGARRFTLDKAGRVTAVDGANWTERYAYDAAGNQTYASWPASPSDDESGATTAQGDRSYQGTLVQRAGGIRYEYDDRGRVTLRQLKRLSAKPLTWRYTWDDEDRLVAAVAPDGERWSYRYNGLGRRISKQRLAAANERVLEEVEFVWDGAVLAEQRNGGRSRAWEWEPRSFRPAVQIDRDDGEGAAPHEGHDAQFYAIITDLVGSPAELVTASGEVVWAARASVWGVASRSSVNAVDCPLRFPGQYHDPETGLHYNYHRYYDPVSARYLSPDPLGLLGGPDPHSYVHNPLAAVDPLGLAPCTTDGQLALPPGRPAQVVPNRLEPHELAQAQRVVDYRGGEFIGAPQRSYPGIDGTLDGVPASLKEYGGSSPAAVLRHASTAEAQAARAGYTGVEVYIDAPGVSQSRLIDFGRQGPLVDIPRQGTVGTIYVRTADGWVVFPG